MPAVFRLPPLAEDGKAAVVPSKGTSADELGTLAMLPQENGLPNGHANGLQNGAHDAYLTGSAAPGWLQASEREDPEPAAGEAVRLEGPALPPKSPFQSWDSGLQR